ncbi:restriction endonuclease subunit R [Candidatus Gottesmanbacteria bacterium CG11_big_fil_rev_8_21_14_0_20_37_11]|uniref:Restriction endonuclease subunit R n=1 Tax=Candidatus Gottesmanbacteria bacterium CG11_big_fil_rev_8_21_14_0_20_37_11 TaxID=1974575 RepID=A0A2H0NI85_9BACT|nr:MAG: restriction endonuclease subunit R [Candidatus Gottesmanbacteria bacterium CG23_combo_of_CG06-09_8_20_14_all_37_19]PIR08594.1 MAG: restriction endonuclease subunit R [Candidatus Gottesmanbacteria bacterium CG11_big_fil_rev_8_21_14_0_20_37_11]
MDTSEKSFEAHIETVLTASGYRKREPKHYNAESCLDEDMLFEFIYATQPKEWEKLKQQHGEEVKAKFIYRLKQEIEKRGTLDVFRKGFADYGSRFQLVCFTPESTLNPEHAVLYQNNIFSIIRQVKFSRKDEKSLDTVIFINGLPIATLELKNYFTGQNVENAIKQYRYDRDQREPLFAFKRCLVHFAVDNDLVYMTTRLAGKSTFFLPFNKGFENGAGNPVNPSGFKSAYLWEEVLQKESLLQILAEFMLVAIERTTDEEGNEKEKETLIFPRYHQLDAVRKMVDHAKEHGAEQNYLIQHSAGSGKTKTISWLAHKLVGLHTLYNVKIFDTVVVVSDRRVIDKQLRDEVLQFQQVEGVVQAIDQHSSQLRDALDTSKKVIVTTLQKFPYIVDEISKQADKKFAVIIDEAHSSQTGESSKSLKKVLGSLEEAATGNAQEEELTSEDVVLKELKSRGRQKNISFFAFTATPKAKTMELFGTKKPNGTFEPFHLYSMRQAIEEGFILDVLKNYTTFQTYFNLIKKTEEDPQYEKKKGIALLKSYVELHDHAIGKKTELVMEHYLSHVRNKIDGYAKSMIVTRSRLHAVRYKLTFDNYIKEHNYPFKTLVAFSGTVFDKDTHKEFTEAGMNGLRSEKLTVETFKLPEYKILIVANKFQTGFDQPLLHTMYVDKKLGGVMAVQTLSRLNRTHKGKDDTMILDFANQEEEIQKAFQPYYDKAILTKATDPNKLYDMERKLYDFHLYTSENVEQFAGVFFKRGATQEKLHPLLDPIVVEYLKREKKERIDFRDQINNYIRLYAFLSQIVSFKDLNLEKLYAFLRMLSRKLPLDKDRLPVEITDNVNMDTYRIQQISSGSIELEKATGELKPMEGLGTGKGAGDEKEFLSLIIEEVNERFGTDFTDGDKVFFAELETRLTGNQTLNQSAKTNTKDALKMVFGHIFEDQLHTMVESNFDIYKKIVENAEFGQFVKEKMFEEVYTKLR